MKLAIPIEDRAGMWCIITYIVFILIYASIMFLVIADMIQSNQVRPVHVGGWYASRQLYKRKIRPLKNQIFGTK